MSSLRCLRCLRRMGRLYRVSGQELDMPRRRLRRMGREKPPLGPGTAPERSEGAGHRRVTAVTAYMHWPHLQWPRPITA